MPRGEVGAIGAGLDRAGEILGDESEKDPCGSENDEDERGMDCWGEEMEREFWLGAENDRDGASLRKEGRDSGLETLWFGEVVTGADRGRLSEREGENEDEGSVRGISSRGAG